MAHKIKCIHCNKELPETEYYTWVLQRQYHICKKCHNKKTLQYAKAYQKRIKNKKKEPNINPDKYIGGINIRILNHLKKGEYKFNILSTGDYYGLKTNSKKEFLDKIIYLCQSLE